ncbi:MAG: tryptophan--tRNA ligase [Polyangiaceae bacterium]
MSNSEAPSPEAPKPPRPATVFSGIQPSGEVHIGNYLGAVRTWVAQTRAAAETGERLLFCLVDAHAITVPYKPKELRKRIDDLAMDLVGAGLDTNNCTLFVQSDVREHTELAWYLSAATPMGDLQRMTQFKDKSENAEFVSTALFTYPVLMSADILLYRATVVPVGDDQLQHLELARETVRRFNHRFGKVFVEPQPRLSNAPRIMGLDGLTKMSKSLNNGIGLFEDSNSFWKKLKGAYTDPQRVQREDPGRPEVCNIYTMHKVMSTEEQQQTVVKNCTTAGWGCFDCKTMLFENFEKELIPLRIKRKETKIEDVRQILGDGAATARSIASETMKRVRSSMGLGGEAQK